MKINKKTRDLLKQLGVETDFRKKRGREFKAFIEDNGISINEFIKGSGILDEILENNNINAAEQNRLRQRRFQTARGNTALAKRLKKNFNASTIQQRFLRNRIFRATPSESSFRSYERYEIQNDRNYLLRRYNPNDMNLEGDAKTFIEFYRIKEYLESYIGQNRKIWISFNVQKTTYRLSYDIINVADIGFTSKGKIIRTSQDVEEMTDDIIRKITQYLGGNSGGESNYYLILSMSIHVAKIKPITGSSYVDLPVFIKNKKAIINIQNNDQKCFLYSVLCSLKTPSKHAQRVSKYKDRLNELKYNEDDMPMDINKIMFFEKRNNLRINVYTIEDKEVLPLYQTHNKLNTDYPLIQLMFYKKHYSYIKDFNRLVGSDGNREKVCPLCMEFRSSGGNSEAAMKKHMENCISGQKVEMPTEAHIKFTHFNHLIDCPIRIYGDFEAMMDDKFSHKSKNGKSSYDKGHTGASFKVLVVSDIPINGYNKIDKYYIKSYLYRGDTADRCFIEYMKKLSNVLYFKIKEVQEKNKNTIIMNEKQKIEHNACKDCWVCRKSFNKVQKVRHHNHNTGHYHSAICSGCNIQIKDTIKIPVMFHNLDYDKNVFFQSFVHYEDIKTISILPDNSEKFKSFSVGNMNFIDSFKFMSSGLEKLIDNLPDKNKIFLRSLASTDEEFEIIKKKGHFPYEWFDSIEKFDLPITELKREHFDNTLRKHKLTDAEWDDVQNTINKLEFKTFGDYHDYYLNVDVNGLADVFENFRKTTLEFYKLDPCHYVGAPALAWDAMLFKTNVKLELLDDIDMYLFFEKGIRGGQSVIFQKHAEANNKYMSNYEKNKESSYISYLDANNLYGWSMSKKLPIDGFEWIENIEAINMDFIENYDFNCDKGYTLDVDLSYPKELHDCHNDYPLAPERFKPQGSTCEKLCGTFYDKKNYIIDIRNLKLYLSLGMKIIKINRGIEFKQTNWLKPWIDFNTIQRTKAKNDFEKDYFKLMNNAVFGKTMENVRGRIDIKVAFNDAYQIKYLSKPNCLKPPKPFKKDGKEFSLIEMSKVKVKLDKPIYAGFTILDLSKYLMYDFHYNTMKPKYGDNIKLLMTDTDSLVYHIKTDDFYKDIYEIREHFDMSEYSKDSEIYDEENKKVIGKFKDEKPNSTITEFIGVRSKCYSMKTDDGKVAKRLKGINKVVVDKEISIANYRNCVLNNETLTTEIHAIRNKGLKNYSFSQTKMALQNTDDKRWFEGIKSYAWGHYKIVKK